MKSETEIWWDVEPLWKLCYRSWTNNRARCLVAQHSLFWSIKYFLEEPGAAEGSEGLQMGEQLAHEHLASLMILQE